ncbi:MAG: MotA/TolQ/ExbB proton channel family protein [Planctomycetota bacterium]|nr:MotA/TolQ/ExbB proton channel family protein [Planctomycetota bacterium]
MNTPRTRTQATMPTVPKASDGTGHVADPDGDFQTEGDLAEERGSSSLIRAAIPEGGGSSVILPTLISFVIAVAFTIGWWQLMAVLPAGIIKHTFSGLYQYLLVLLLVWHLSLIVYRAWFVWRPEARALRVEWLPGDGPLTADEVQDIARSAAEYEAQHGHRMVTRRLLLIGSHLHARGSISEVSGLLERRAEADRGRAEDAYGLPRFLFWAIPILGFIGTVVGIGSAIAGLKGGDITSAEVLREQIGHVAGSLGEAFYATQVALIFSVIALLAQTMLYQAEMRLHDDIEDLLTYRLESRLVGGGADQEALVRALEAHIAALREDSERRDEATRQHVQALISGHEQLAEALARIGDSSRSLSQEVAKTLTAQVQAAQGELTQAVAKAVADIHAAVQRLREQRQQDAAAQQALIAALTQAAQQLRPVAEQLRQPIRLQLSMAPVVVEAGGSKPAE